MLIAPCRKPGHAGAALPHRRSDHQNPNRLRDQIMKKLLFAFAMSCALLGATGISAAQAASAQNQKMSQCNTEATAKGLKGSARKDFMKQCLSAKAATAAPARKLTAQQQKMVDCNAQAKTRALKGDARKKFMKECLSSKK
jgi:hypothetical protein